MKVLVGSAWLGRPGLVSDGTDSSRNVSRNGCYEWPPCMLIELNASLLL